jgi:hypothetical protein
MYMYICIYLFISRILSKFVARSRRTERENELTHTINIYTNIDIWYLLLFSAMFISEDLRENYMLNYDLQ